MNISDLKNKRVAIFGYGREGRSTQRVLKERLPDLEPGILDDERKEVSAEDLKDFEVVIISPGISIYRDEVVEAKKDGVIFTTHANLWFAENPRAFTICVTGTKGKSTTSSLICHFLKSLGKNAVLGGNFGVPLFELSHSEIDYYVIELSSYQIASLEAQPKIALFLNLYPEHLDWHKTKEQYFRDKVRILNFSGETVRITNAKDPISIEYIPKERSQIYFCDRSSINHRGREIYDGSQRLFSLEGLKLIGDHNLDNLCGALCVIKALNLPLEECVQFLSTFNPLPHRMSVLGCKEGVTFINDSISTIPEAALAAVKSLEGKDITILLGGFDRGRDFTDFARALVESNLKHIVTMGESGKRLFENIKIKMNGRDKSSPTLYYAGGLREAIEYAKKITKAEGVILMSPAAPSYGEFKNFEERGDLFTQYCGF